MELKVQVLCLFWFWRLIKKLSGEQTFSWLYCGVKGQSNSLVYMCTTKSQWSLPCSRLLWWFCEVHHTDPLTARRNCIKQIHKFEKCLQENLHKFCTYNNQSVQEYDLSHITLMKRLFLVFVSFLENLNICFIFSQLCFPKSFFLFFRSFVVRTKYFLPNRMSPPQPSFSWVSCHSSHQQRWWNNQCCRDRGTADTGGSDKYSGPNETIKTTAAFISLQWHLRCVRARVCVCSFMRSKLLYF